MTLALLKVSGSLLNCREAYTLSTFLKIFPGEKFLESSRSFWYFSTTY